MILGAVLGALVIELLPPQGDHPRRPSNWRDRASGVGGGAFFFLPVPMAFDVWPLRTLP